MFTHFDHFHNVVPLKWKHNLQCICYLICNLNFCFHSFNGTKTIYSGDNIMQLRISISVCQLAMSVYDQRLQESRWHVELLHLPDTGSLTLLCNVTKVALPGLTSLPHSSSTTSRGMSQTSCCGYSFIVFQTGTRDLEGNATLSTSITRVYC